MTAQLDCLSRFDFHAEFVVGKQRSSFTSTWYHSLAYLLYDQLRPILVHAHALDQADGLP